GTVASPSGEPCRAGWVFAWSVERTPRPEEFRACVTSGGVPALAAAPITSDGSFRLARLPKANAYVLGAVARGAACVERPTGIHAGATRVALGLKYLYGTAIRFEEHGGVPLRTSSQLYGGGPKLRRGRAPWRELHAAPELAALGITGLDPGARDHYREQRLAVADVELEQLGPLDYAIQVPGYRERSQEVYQPRVLERLAETVLELEPSVASWETISVRL